jgi:hypothetical protein
MIATVEEEEKVHPKVSGRNNTTKATMDTALRAQRGGGGGQSSPYAKPMKQGM